MNFLHTTPSHAKLKHATHSLTLVEGSLNGSSLKKKEERKGRGKGKGKGK